MYRLLETLVLLIVGCSLVSSAATERRTSRVRAEKKFISNPLHTLSLPSNATAIRSDITDQFSCANKAYGYYADVDNDCQLFHVCLPVTYADGRERMYRWSFICPEETVFSQEAFTCVRKDEIAFDCASSEGYYDLNRNIGAQEEVKDVDSNELGTSSTASSGNRRNQQKPTIVQNNRSNLTIASSTVAPKATTAPSQSTSRPINTASVITTKRTRRPTATPPLPIASVPKETNTLLESALKKVKPAKIARIPVAVEATTFDRPTTVVTEEATTDLPQTTVVQTTPEFLYTRIVPELLEKNEKAPVQPAEPLISTLINAQTNNEADELIRNIKQLQNSMLLSASSTTNSAVTPIVEKSTASVHGPLPRRFLFKADAIKNRLKQ